MTIPNNTFLWQRAFGEHANDFPEDEKRFFESHLLEIRQKADTLVSRISADMHGYTIHDVSHLDALWETASLVADPKLILNPPEAFVFGAAVLLHDAGMTLAAYPRGIDDLKQTVEWGDAEALLAGRVWKNESELQEAVKIDVLRRLHPRKAEELATQGWSISDDEDRQYLLSDSDLREFYGPTVGVIARSHWWAIERVEGDLDRILGPMAPRTRNSVDVLKIACLLRVADALHLDRRRAPRFARSLEKPKGLSALHWTAQERLAFPYLSDDAVVFTAGGPFSINEAEAWWTAYDALEQADRELRSADLLLRDRRGVSLSARRVRGVGDPTEMARYIPVTNWRPVDTGLRVSDITKVVESLGGEKLYGSNVLAPLRELLQNGMDAIQARRRLQRREQGWGSISVKMFEHDGAAWLSVEDSGVGMSETVLTRSLLDFGNSFWRSPQVAEEFPGLSAQGMNASGRFGIGFFSIFMLGDYAKVITRRFDRSDKDALVLEFADGLSSRPILRAPVSEKIPMDGGTRIELKLSNDPRQEKGGIKFEFKSGNRGVQRIYNSDDTLGDIIAFIAPSSGVTIEVTQFGDSQSGPEANDWLTLEPAKLLARVSNAAFLTKKDFSRMASLVRDIKGPDDRIYGRTAVWPEHWQEVGALTAGGLRVKNIDNFAGVIVGEVDRAARDEGEARIPTDVLASWASNQATLIKRMKLPDAQKALSAEVILSCGGDIKTLPIVEWGGRWLNRSELRKSIAKSKKITMHAGFVTFDEDSDYLPKPVFERGFTLDKEILLIPTMYPWRLGEYQIKKLVEKMIHESWGTVEEIEDDAVSVGTAGGESIVRRTTIFVRAN